MKVRKFLNNDGLEAVKWYIDTYRSVLNNGELNVCGALELTDGYNTITFDTDQVKGLIVLIEEIQRFNQEYLKTLGLIDAKKTESKKPAAKKTAKKKAK